jgi:hypothetical protein
MKNRGHMLTLKIGKHLIMLAQPVRLGCPLAGSAQEPPPEAVRPAHLESKYIRSFGWSEM